MSNVTKSFLRGTVVLDDVSFRLQAGTIHALLGENGAGKTTLMRIAFGLHAADRGETVAGTPPRPIHSPIDAIAAGLGMVHQHFTNAPAMTVAENVALGGHRTLRRGRGVSRGRRNRRAYRIEARPRREGRFAFGGWAAAIRDR
jgi:ABC-type uncharacterized transport system ATPase subunit